MAAIQFEEHADWPLTLRIARYLQALLRTSEIDFLEYRCHGVDTDSNVWWKTLPLHIRGTVERIEGATYTLANEGAFMEDQRPTTVETCVCTTCVSSSTLKPLQEGDQIYELEDLINNARTDDHLYVALRPDGNLASCGRYVGALGSHGFSRTLLLHSLPASAAEYKMDKHIRHDDQRPEFLRLEVCPPTLEFLLTNLADFTPTQSSNTIEQMFQWMYNYNVNRTVSDQSTAQRRSFTWKHDMSLHFGQQSTNPDTVMDVAELRSIANSIFGSMSRYNATAQRPVQGWTAAQSATQDQARGHTGWTPAVSVEESRLYDHGQGLHGMGLHGVERWL